MHHFCSLYTWHPYYSGIFKPLKWRFLKSFWSLLRWKLVSCFLVCRRENGGLGKWWHRHPCSPPDCFLSDMTYPSGIRHTPITWPLSGRKQTASAWTTSGDCSMDNTFQALLTLLSSLADVVQLNSTFCNAATAYTCRRQAIIQVICN